MDNLSIDDSELVMANTLMMASVFTNLDRLIAPIKGPSCAIMRDQFWQTFQSLEDLSLRLVIENFSKVVDLALDGNKLSRSGAKTIAKNLPQLTRLSLSKRTETQI